MTPYRTIAVNALLACLLLALVSSTQLLACKAALPFVQAALTASQLACAFESAITDANALAEACAIDKALVPDLQQLIGEREGAKKAGVTWHHDAGSADASAP